jgi:dienelactone hydrolase
VGQIAFGKYLSPDYMVHPGEFIPAVATRTGVPQVRSMNEIYFNLYLPSGQKPVTGWPVAIFTHSANGSKEGGRNIAASLAAHGIATIIINHVGHGGGPLTTLTVTTKNGAATTFSASGRGIDQNGDRVIGAREGDTAASPRTLSQDTDGIRQTVADLMQLVRVIEIGMDIDGDGRIDLDRGRIYSVGASLGGLTSMIFMAVEPDVRAAVFMSPGGPVVENLRLSPVQRTPSIGAYLASRSPSLINAPGMTSVGGVAVAAPFFNENKPLKNQPPVINTVRGAIAIQTVLDRMEWVSQPGNYVGYVRHLRKDPLEGVPAKSILLHFGKGDQGTPNVNTSEILLTGDLADRALFYRHDVAFADNPTLPKDSHLFSLGFRGGNLTAPPIAAIALPAQEQIAIFFESHGSIMNQPQPVRYFESPVSLPLPDGLSYIP